MPLSRILCALVGIISIVCVNPDIAVAQATGISIQDLATADFQNVTVAFLESKIGPAMAISANPQQRSYKINGCPLTAYVSGATVEGYEITLSPACSIDLSSLTGGLNIKNAKTFGQFDKAVGNEGLYQASCLVSCGNAADPVVQWYWQGPHAAQFVTLRLTAVLAGDDEIKASNTWTDAMAKEGEDYVLETKFNCDAKYNNAAIKAFQSVKVSQIYFGADISQSDGSGCRGG